MRLSKKLLLTVLALILIIGGISRYFFAVPEREPPALGGTLESAQLEIDGIRRTFKYYLPAEIPPGAPVVIALHASQGNGLRMRRATGWALDLLADEHGFIVAYPDGYERHWNDCRAAGDYSANRLDIDDVSFIRGLLAFLEKEHGARRGDALAFGLSNGGQMSYRLALEAPDTIAAAVALAAGMPAKDNLDCEPSGKPVAVLIVNGTDDPINPYEGGEVDFFGDFGSRGRVESSRESAAYWARLAGHDEPLLELRLPDRVPEDDTVAMLASWSSGAGPAVALITVYGGGHTIPHPDGVSPRIFGRVNRDFSAAEEAWRTFRAEMDRRGVPVDLD